MDERASDPDYYGKGLGIAGRKGNDALLQEIPRRARQGESIAGICANAREMVYAVIQWWRSAG